MNLARKQDPLLSRTREERRKERRVNGVTRAPRARVPNWDVITRLEDAAEDRMLLSVRPRPGLERRSPGHQDHNNLISHVASTIPRDQREIEDVVAHQGEPKLREEERLAGRD